MLATSLYWRDWHERASLGDWIGFAFGLTLTIGALAGIAAVTIGITVTRPNVMRFHALGRQVTESGAPPSPEVAAEMSAIQVRLKVFARISLALLAVAVLGMAAARYL